MISKVKKAARAARIRDPQNRKVRAMLPVKVKKTDESGNLLLCEVVWDHIHKMSCDHALLAFEQRDENINKQKRAATRDLESCLENNPNVQGKKQKFLFDFMLEEHEASVVEEIEETHPRKPK